MLYLMLATFRKDAKTIVGYNFYEYNTKKIVQVSADKLTELVKDGSKIVNADLATTKKGIQLVGNNGTVDRYPILDLGGNVIGKSPLVVISRLNDGFRLLNAYGKMTLLTTKEAVLYCKFNGIANGKITSIKGTETISSISGTYPDEDLSIEKLRKAEAPKTEKVAEAKQDFGKEFYLALERAFGKDKANLIKYLIEDKKAAPNTLVDIAKSHEKGIALAGLIFYTGDKGKDEKLTKLLTKLVDKEALSIVDYMTDKGIVLENYWDCKVYLRKHKTSDKDIDRGFMENCVGNYIIEKGPFENITISDDGTFATYKGTEVSKADYTVAGYNPVTRGISFINEEGTAKVAKLKD